MNILLGRIQNLHDVLRMLTMVAARVVARVGAMVVTMVMNRALHSRIDMVVTQQQNRTME